jgi:hypothetical protein
MALICCGERFEGRITLDQRSFMIFSGYQAHTNPFMAGFGLRSFARYVVRGLMLSSSSIANSWYRASSVSDTSLFGIVDMLPNVMHSAGHACSTRCFDFTVTDWSVLPSLAVDRTCRDDSLCAIGAFFHDTAETNW